MTALERLFLLLFVLGGCRTAADVMAREQPRIPLAIVTLDGVRAEDIYELSHLWALAARGVALEGLTLGALFGALLAGGVGFPIPEEIPLLAAGYLVWRGNVALPSALLTCLVGVALGDAMLYSLGRIGWVRRESCAPNASSA